MDGIQSGKEYGLTIGKVVLAADDAIEKANKLGVDSGKARLDIFIALTPPAGEEVLQDYVQWLRDMGVDVPKSADSTSARLQKWITPKNIDLSKPTKNEDVDSSGGS